MRKPAPNAFTLVELLVVIAIIAVVGTITLAQYKPFGEDQSLKNTVLDIQSLMRQTQAFSSSNAICQTKTGALWQVVFSDNNTVILKCFEPGVEHNKKTLDFPLGVIIDKVEGAGTDCPVSSVPSPFVSFAINYTLLSGKLNLGNENCASVTLTLVNKAGTEKSLTFDQSGKIYEEQ